MSLIKSRKSRKPWLEASWTSEDPVFSSLLDTRRNLFNMSRLFEREFNGGLDLTPSMNIKDQEKEFEVELAAPGLSKNDFEISIDDGILTISAEKKEEHEEEEDEGFLRKEFNYSTFERTIALPDTIDENKDVKAKYKDGILKLNLAKKHEKKSKKAKKIKVD